MFRSVISRDHIVSVLKLTKDGTFVQTLPRLLVHAQLSFFKNKKKLEGKNIWISESLNQARLEFLKAAEAR